MSAPVIDDLIRALGKLPGIGPRSARRLALHLLQNKESGMAPLMTQLERAHTHVKTCTECGNLDGADPCHICTSTRRNTKILCVVQSVGDVWAIERTRSYDGLYHVLGGVLSALDGVRPEDLRIPQLLSRVESLEATEVVLALSATVDGQTTAHYLADRLSGLGIKVSRLAHGVPIGGELDYLDDGTLVTALKSRTSYR